MQLGILILWCVTISTVTCGNYYVRTSGDASSECFYHEYKPGGSVKVSGEIKSPQFASTNTQLSQVMKRTGQALELLDGVVNFSLKLMEAVPALSPALAIFSGISSIVGDNKELSAEEVMGKAQNAMDELTSEVNKKFDNMHDYIDQSLLDENKILLQKIVDVFFRNLNHCMRKESRKRANECQEQVYRDIDGWHDHYAIYQKEFGFDHPEYLTDFYNAFDGYKIRELEAFLLPIRNYATVEILVLRPIIDVFLGECEKVEKQKNIDKGKALEALEKELEQQDLTEREKQDRRDKLWMQQPLQCRIAENYIAEMQNKTRFFNAYFERAKTAIEHYWKGEARWSPCYKKEQVKCHYVKMITESNVDTAKDFRCECQMDAKAKCTQHFYVRYDTASPSDYTRVRSSNRENAVHQFGYETMKKYRQNMESSALGVVRDYLTVEIDPFIKGALNDGFVYANKRAVERKMEKIHYRQFNG